MSIEENAVPKRRSSAANRRRGRKASSQVTGAVPQATTSTSVVTAETEPERKPARSLRRKVAEPEAPVVETADTAQPVDRNLQRREERRRAKQQKPERSGVGRVVNTERMGGVKKFYYDTSSEIRKVVWPDRDTTRNLTIVVMVMSVIMGFLLGGIDFVLFRLFEAIT